MEHDLIIFCAFIFLGALFAENIVLRDMLLKLQVPLVTINETVAANTNIMSPSVESVDENAYERNNYLSNSEPESEVFQV